MTAPPPSHGAAAPIPDGISLTAFLTQFLGAWPPTHELTVIGSTARTQPGWDGHVTEVIGVASPAGTVLSVPPDRVTAVQRAVASLADLTAQLGPTLGQPGARLLRGAFRWTMQPANLPEAGRWLAVDDVRVPQWLHPFGGAVLVRLIDDRYAAGVGLKRHNPAGIELSVGTEPAHRGQGIAASLVAQAAHWVIAQGAVPIYLHDPANVASARTADAAGFPDLGWQIVGLSPR